MYSNEFEKVAVGVADWPVRLNRKQQRVVVLGLAAADRGVSIGRLQDALIESVQLSKTSPIVSGRTRKSDTKNGRGYVDQWFTPSWVPMDVIVEKSINYDYCIRSSRVRLVPRTEAASEKLLMARRTIERLCLT